MPPSYRYHPSIGRPTHLYNSTCRWRTLPLWLTGRAPLLQHTLGPPREAAVLPQQHPPRPADPPHLFNDMRVVPPRPMHPLSPHGVKSASRPPAWSRAMSARSPRLTCCRYPNPHKLAPQKHHLTSHTKTAAAPRLHFQLHPTSYARTRVPPRPRDGARAAHAGR